MYKLMTITTLSLVAIPAFANQNMTCISDGAFVHCNLDQADHRDITIKNVIAGDCLQANVWGVDSTGIWVDKGCGASFEYTAAATASVNNNYTDSAAYNEGYSESTNTYNEPWYYAPWLYEPWLPYYNYYPYYGSQVFYYGNGQHHEAWNSTHNDNHNSAHGSFHDTSHGTSGTGTTTHNGGMSTFHGATNAHGNNGTSSNTSNFHDGSTSHGTNTSHGGGTPHGGGGSHGGGKKH